MTSKIHPRAWTDFLITLNPLALTGIALFMSWLLTTLGSLPACCIDVPKNIRSVFYAMVAGTMVASATVGMLQESISRAEEAAWSRSLPWIPATVGMILGLLLLQAVILLVAYVHEKRKRVISQNLTYIELKGENGNATVRFNEHDLTSEPSAMDDIAKRAREDAEARLTPASAAALETVAPRTSESKKAANVRRAIMMVSALALQQMPEGLMLGVSFANVSKAPREDKDHAMRVALSGAIAVWLGSIPEGLAMMLPLRKVKVNPIRGLIFVQIAMFMQILAGMTGCLLATFVTSILPFALGAVASAMIFTSFSEIIPATYKAGSRTLSNIIIMAGFMLMVILINLFE